MNKINMFYWWSTMLMVTSMTMMFNGMKMMLTKKIIMMEWELIKLNSSEVNFMILMDWMSFTFMSTVMMISSMIIMYSNNYMSEGKYKSKRFIMLINLFIMSMMLMIISPNMISIMLGWDGLGMVSYCLVIFYSSKKSYNAGMITCLTNRMGDIGLLISISWMMSYGSWHFMFYKELYSNVISYLIIMSCFTKSAQMPFYSWLPEAMSAPTPISALVHSSTLVTAGIYLSIRFMNKVNKNWMLMMSMLTMMMSSICANFEFDIKKIIALSTLSQLSMMMSSILLGMKEMSFLHLITHAMFKSLLFMCAGIMIFYTNNNQDIRNLSQTYKTLPMTTSCFSISTLALCGIPFMSGFYSKDLIIEMMMTKKMNIITMFMMNASLGLTMSYSLRMMYFILMKNMKTKMIIKTKKMNKMKLSTILLTMMSVCLGSLIMWMINLNLKMPIITTMMKINPITMIILGMWMGMESFSFKNYLLKNSMYLMNSNMWNILSKMKKNQKMLLKLSLMFKMKVNSEWGEFYGAMGMSKYLMKTSKMTLMSSKKMMLISMMTWMMSMM
uniref:NADH-ubiquinone oxidoreductase chain 5 n=1 Tax=Complanledra complana TaxID=3078487 RepID=A0AAU6PCH8_9HEMI